MSWAIHHTQSEELASQAEDALRKGDKARARELYRLSAEAEERALASLDPGKKRTLGITAVSAASLWFKAGEFKQAERLACHWIASDSLPAFAATQMQEILQVLWGEAIFRQSGIEFLRGEVAISLHGGEVGIGAAPLQLVHQKTSEICTFFYRIVEMLLKRPFRKRGFPRKDILENFRPWLLQYPPGSYQFAVRIQRPSQLSLFPEPMPETEEVMYKFMQVIRAIIQESPDILKEVVVSSDYRSGFLKMSRNLAPRGKIFDRLEIRSTIDPYSPPVVLVPESRNDLNRILQDERSIENVGIQEEKLLGTLRALHLDRDWIELKPDGDKPLIRIHQTGDVIDDIVGPMVNQRVIVSVAVQSNGRYLYRDIELEE
jgi:hypothetical protein